MRFFPNRLSGETLAIGILGLPGAASALAEGIARTFSALNEPAPIIVRVSSALHEPASLPTAGFSVVGEESLRPSSIFSLKAEDAGAAGWFSLFRDDETPVGRVFSVQFSERPGLAIVSSNGPGAALPIVGTVQQQLTEINAGTPLFSPQNWIGVLRKTDVYGCGVNTEPGQPPDPCCLMLNCAGGTVCRFVLTQSPLVGLDEVAHDNCASAWYRFTFEMPDNFRNATFTGAANVSQLAVAYLNGHQLSATIALSDVGIDRTDGQGRAALTQGSADAFGTSNNAWFLPGENELLIGMTAEPLNTGPAGMEFTSSIEFDYPLADGNCDGIVDFFDIDPFLLALFSPAGYTSAYPNCDIRNADINNDGAVDFFDIDPFVACLFGGCP